MASTVLDLEARGDPGLLVSLQRLRTAWGKRSKRAADARALARSAHLGPRLLADMGIEDATVLSLVGDWDDLRPNRMLIRPRD